MLVSWQFSFGALVPTMGAQRPSPAPAPTRLQLTVDSIMRGPELVGWPPTQLRWSPDSRHLYFSWRKPGDKTEALYVVARDGGAPRQLSEEEARNAPPANGRWDAAKRRLLATDGADVILYDGSTSAGTFVTRTTGAESNARWARNDTHVTYVRDGNLFIVPVEGGSLSVTQLTDVALKKAEPRLTDSQRFIRDEEEKLIGYLRQQKEQKQRAEDKAKLLKLPAFELQDRQSAADLMLSPDGAHVFILVNERPTGAKNTIVPNYVSETGYTEDIPGRTNVGDTQDRRLLAILNLKTGKSVWADGSFAPPVTEITNGSSPKATADRAEKENWELAVYPVENHSFTEETSWADEYRRILKLFEDKLRSR